MDKKIRLNSLKQLSVSYTNLIRNSKIAQAERLKQLKETRDNINREIEVLIFETGSEKNGKVNKRLY